MATLPFLSTRDSPWPVTSTPCVGSLSGMASSARDVDDLDAVHFTRPTARQAYGAVVWCQDTHTVTIYAACAARAHQIDVELRADTIRVGGRQPTPSRAAPQEVAAPAFSGRLGGTCDPDESTWYIEGNELVVQLHKARAREWPFPYTPQRQPASEPTFEPTSESTSEPASEPSTSQAPPKPAPQTLVTTTRSNASTKSALHDTYASWDRFDAEEALLAVENQGLGDEPSGWELRAGAGSASVRATGYRKDREEIRLDDDLAQRRGELQASLNERLAAAAEAKAAANALLKVGRLAEALQGYEDALCGLELFQSAQPLLAPTLASAVFKLGVDLRNNASLAALRLGDATRAAELAKATLCVAPDDEKAAYRLQKAELAAQARELGESPPER